MSHNLDEYHKDNNTMINEQYIPYKYVKNMCL